MIDVEPLIVSGLDRLVPLPGGERADWEDVLARAGVRRRRRRLTRRRLVVALAALAAAAVVVAATPVGSAIVQGIGDFSAWLTGHPGTPASSSEQQAFERSQRSWLAFPKGTELRRLIETTVQGSTYTLDGFRARDELCLRLTVTGKAHGEPLQSCAPRAELRARKEPALVVFVDYGFGPIRGRHVHIGPDTYTPVRADVTAGIVADGVKAVELAGDGGRRRRAIVGANSFLSVAANPKVGYRTRHVWATADGRRIPIPFAQAPFDTWRSPPSSILKPQGPSRVERKVTGGRIGWLERREQRGATVPATLDRFYARLGKVVFERLLTPDPTSLMRVIVTVQVGGQLSAPPGFPRSKAPHVCTWLVAGGTVGGGCNPENDLFPRQPFSAGESVLLGSDQYATIDGLASDDVARLELFLGTGERIPVPLRDGAFLVQAARPKYPARLVAYDRQGRVVGIQTFQEPLSNTGPRPVPNAHWRTLIRATSGPMHARLMIAPQVGGGTCYAFRWGVNGGGSSGCVPRKWMGPPIQVYFNEPQVLHRGPSVFLAGQVRPDIVRIDVHLPGRRVLTIKPKQGFVLVAVPVKYARAAHNGTYALGFDRAGKQVARGSLGGSYSVTRKR
jgi:hypothetical protein